MTSENFKYSTTFKNHFCFCILLTLESFSFLFIVMENRAGVVYCIYFLCFKKARKVWKNVVGGQTEVKLCLDWISYSCRLEFMLLIAINTVFVRKNNEACSFCKKVVGAQRHCFTKTIMVMSNRGKKMEENVLWIPEVTITILFACKLCSLKWLTLS